MKWDYILHKHLISWSNPSVNPLSAQPLSPISSSPHSNIYPPKLSTRPSSPLQETSYFSKACFLAKMVYIPHILFPLYFSGSWTPLYNEIAAYPNVTFNVIINPDSGPGSSTYPNSDFIAGITKLSMFYFLLHSHGHSAMPCKTYLIFWLLSYWWRERKGRKENR